VAHAIKMLYVKYHGHQGGGYHPLSFIDYNICICEINIENNWAILLRESEATFCVLITVLVKTASVSTPTPGSKAQKCAIRIGRGRPTRTAIKRQRSMLT